MELQKIHGLITNITQHYSAFAVDAEGHNTFITNNLARFLQLTVGDQVLMDVVPNHPDKAQTIPYRAVGCVKLKESLPEEEPEQLRRASRWRSGCAFVPRYDLPQPPWSHHSHRR